MILEEHRHVDLPVFFYHWAASISRGKIHILRRRSGREKKGREKRRKTEAHLEEKTAGRKNKGERSPSGSWR